MKLPSSEAPQPSADAILLRQQVDHYKDLFAFNREVDEAIELAMRERLSLRRTLDRLFPLVLKGFQAAGVFLHTYDETMAMSSFVTFAEHTRYGKLPEDPAEVARRVESGQRYVAQTVDAAPGWGASVIAQRLDVAGEFFGALGIVLPQEAPQAIHLDHVYEKLDVFAEELDNFLSAIQQTREKHGYLVRISEALKHRVLDTGIEQAVAVLAEVVRFDRLVLFYHDETAPEAEVAGHRLQYKVFNQANLVADSRRRPDSGMTRLYLSARSRTEVIDRATLAEYLIDGLAEELGEHRFREEFLINGVVEETVVGKVLVSSTQEEFHPFDRDLIERFADAMRQRIVDFNKERRQLRQFFSLRDTERLLATPSYHDEYLSYRTESIAVMYADICSFTAIAEQVLVDPARVGELVNRWSARAAEIVWENGGVLDKLVGDCLIALFGPPFFEADAADVLRRAIESAMMINDWTISMGDSDEYKAIAESEVAGGLACSAGINHAELTVGFFGPNGDYTCFGSGMNNAARLQGAAGFSEIALMEHCVPLVEPVTSDVFRFSDTRESTAKNVKEPLRYRIVTRLADAE